MIVSQQQPIYAQPQTYQSPQKVIQQGPLYNSEVPNADFRLNAGQFGGNSANSSQNNQINTFQPANSYVILYMYIHHFIDLLNYHNF